MGGKTDPYEAYSSELSRILSDFYNILSAWEDKAIETLNAGLSVVEAHAIEALGRQPNLKMRELAEILCVTTPSVTAVVDKLETKGFARGR